MTKDQIHINLDAEFFCGPEIHIICSPKILREIWEALSYVDIAKLDSPGQMKDYRFIMAKALKATDELSK